MAPGGHIRRRMTPNAPSPRPSLWRAALRVAVPTLALVVLVVAVAPRARGIAFPMELRYAVVAPLTFVAVLAAIALHRARGRRALRGAVAVGAASAAMAIAGLGGADLVAAAIPALVVGAIALAVLVPRAVDGPPRPRLRHALMALLGVLELVMLGGAVLHESAPPPGPDGLRFEIPRTAFDVEHHFVELPDGARIHYVDEGTGPVLLFLHGNPAWSFQWRALIAGLRGSYRCIALDYPGFGLSDAATDFDFSAHAQSVVVEAFVDHLGLGELTLVIHDWGGPIGLDFAGRRPELIRGIVLGNTWAWPTDPGTPRGWFSRIVGGPLGEFLQVNFNAFAAMAMDGGVVGRLSPEVAELYLRPFRAHDRRGIAAFYPGQILEASPQLAEVEARLDRIADRPALLFWGLRDPGFPRADLERFEQHFPDHRTFEFADADHFFFEDTAPIVIEEIDAFMARARG